MSRIKGVDGVRAVACLMIITLHTTQNIGFSNIPLWILNTKNFLWTGSAGVTIFFVLSGMLLSIPFWNSYFEDKEFPSIEQYVVRRAGRIMPGFYVSMFVNFFIGLFIFSNYSSGALRYLAGLTFVAPWHWLTFFPVDTNGPLWSIGFEVVSYALMPIAMYFLFKSKERSFSKAVLFWINIWIITLILHYVALKFFLPSDFGKGWQYGAIGGAKEWMPNYNPIGFFAQFTIGIFTGLLITKYRKLKKKRVTEKHFDILSLIFIIAAIAILYSRVGKGEFTLTFLNQPYYFPIFPIVIGGLLFSLDNSKFMYKLADNKFFTLTSKLSFGIYIWHYLIMNIVPQFFEPNYRWGTMTDMKSWAVFTLYIFVASYIIAYISWEYLEKPILNRAQIWSPQNESLFDMLSRNKTKILVIVVVFFIVPLVVGYIKNPSIFTLDLKYFK